MLVVLLLLLLLMPHVPCSILSERTHTHTNIPIYANIYELLVPTKCVYVYITYKPKSGIYTHFIHHCYSIYLSFSFLFFFVLHFNISNSMFGVTIFIFYIHFLYFHLSRSLFEFWLHQSLWLKIKFSLFDFPAIFFSCLFCRYIYLIFFLSFSQFYFSVHFFYSLLLLAIICSSFFDIRCLKIHL